MDVLFGVISKITFDDFGSGTLAITGINSEPLMFSFRKDSFWIHVFEGKTIQCFSGMCFCRGVEIAEIYKNTIDFYTTPEVDWLITEFSKTNNDEFIE